MHNPGESDPRECVRLLALHGGAFLRCAITGELWQCHARRQTDALQAVPLWRKTFRKGQDQVYFG